MPGTQFNPSMEATTHDLSIYMSNIKFKHKDLSLLATTIEDINARDGGPYSATRIDRAIWRSQLCAARNLVFLGRGRYGYITIQRLSRFLWAFANDAAREYLDSAEYVEDELTNELDLAMTVQVNFIMTKAQECYDHNRTHGLTI